jgi:hypothetical protein
MQDQIKTNQLEWHNLEMEREKLKISLFALRHQGQIKFEFLDLTGYKVGEAEEKVYEMLLIVRDALDGSFVRPNQGNGVDHVYKIAGLKGRAQFELA